MQTISHWIQRLMKVQWMSEWLRTRLFLKICKFCSIKLRAFTSEKNATGLCSFFKPWKSALRFALYVLSLVDDSAQELYRKLVQNIVKPEKWKPENIQKVVFCNSESAHIICKNTTKGYLTLMIIIWKACTIPNIHLFHAFCHSFDWFLCRGLLSCSFFAFMK